MTRCLKSSIVNKEFTCCCGYVNKLSNDEVFSKQFYCAGCQKYHLLDDNGYLNHLPDESDNLKNMYNSSIPVMLISGHKIIIEESNIGWPATRLSQIEEAIGQCVLQKLKNKGLAFSGLQVAFRSGKKPKDDLIKALESYEPDKEKFINNLVNMILVKYKNKKEIEITYIQIKIT